MLFKPKLENGVSSCPHMYMYSSSSYGPLFMEIGLCNLFVSTFCVVWVGFAVLISSSSFFFFVTSVLHGFAFAYIG